MGYPRTHFDDIDLITVFCELIELALEAKGIDIPVVQLDQPTMQPRGESAVYFTHLFDKRFGWSTSDMKFDEANDHYVFTESQHMIGTIQISVLYPAQPGDDSRITAKDLTNYLAQKMNSMNYVRFFRAAGIGVMRIPHVRSQVFENDRGQYEFMPSFDMELAYNRQIGDVVPKIVELMGIIKRV